MRILLFLFLFYFYSSLLSAQNLSFTCPKDTVLGCSVNCLNISASFPDLRGQATNDYDVLNVTSTVGACYPLIDPGSPGPSTSLVLDDRYSAIIPLPFSFTFYGVPYSSLVVSTNGYISFDITNTGGTSHYQDYGDLPTSSYDKALIMGPYHDLDPSVNTSPTRQIKYNVIGIAPNRKWVLSFYKIPLFGTSCGSLIENTSQIVLHETTNIVEVSVFDQEICTSWIGGKAMIGIQDFTRTKGVMAPNRFESSPAWGTIGMNETWRFVPKQGPHLYRNLQLLDGTGAVIATGDTTRLNSSTFGWTFPNVCTTPGGPPTYFVIKTTYEDAVNPAATFYSLDSIRVTPNQFVVTAISTNTTCGSGNGSITATSMGGVAPYTYSLNGGAGQASNVFSNLAAGSYTVTVTDVNGCTGTRTVIVALSSSLTATFSKVNASCPGVANGSITVNPTNGVAPYSYSANGGPSQLSNTFNNLIAGTYTIVFTDANGCIGSVVVTISPGSSIGGSATSTATSCNGAADGTITATGSGGVGPYTFSLDGGPFQASNVFTGVSAGNHIVTIMDSRGCTKDVPRTVAAGTSILSNSSTTSASCNTASDGTITINPTNGTGPYLYSLNGGPQQSSNIFTGLAPGNYTITITDNNGCTGTKFVSVGGGNGVTGTAVATNTSCPTRNDGTITVSTGTPGTYTYTLTPGNIVQVNNPVYNNLAAGTYSVSFVNTVGCSGSVNNIVIVAGPALTSSTVTNNPVCANVNDGTVTINPTAGTGPYMFVLGTNPPQSSPIFTNLGPGSYTYSFTDANGCTGTGSFTLASNTVLKVPGTTTRPLCNGNSNGVIVFNPSGGVTPYQYLLQPGTTYQSSNTFNGLAAGTYTFTIKDNVGCTKDTSVTITEPAILNASASNTLAATCKGDDGTIVVSGSGGTTNYMYSIDGTTFQSSATFIAPNPGTYNNIKIKDANGCIANATATVLLLDTMRLSLGTDTVVCVGSSITLQPQTNDLTSVFTWTSIPAASVSTLDNATVKNPIATPTDTTTYILNARWGVCTRQDDVVVNVLAKPVPHAGADTTICAGVIIDLRGSATNVSGPVTYAWAPGFFLNRTDSSVVTAKLPDGSNTLFTLTVKDNYGCNFSVTDDIRIIVRPRVKAFAGNDTIAVKGIPHQLYGSGGSQYTWSPAAPLNNGSIQNPLATLNNDTRFTLVVRDVIGCLGYDTVFLKVYTGPTYYTPSAFTPNNDGRNDIFRAVPVGIVSTDYFRIFDRYGMLIFQTNKWLQGWDGTYQGKPQPVGAYVWIIKGLDRNGKIVEQKGTVVLIR